jgi:uncharacterized RDD family membrane protein YckC
MSNPDLLREEYTIDTPENVTFGYTIAGIGSRFVGALVETTLLVLALVLLNLAVALLLAWLADNTPPIPVGDEPAPDWIAGLLLALYALFNFAIIWGYYLAFELLWNGQTPGKRLAHTQVVRANGAPAGFGEIAIRNVVRIVDFLPFAYAVGFVVMFFNKRARRLGDFAANTLVIKQQERVTLADLTARAVAAPVARATRQGADAAADVATDGAAAAATAEAAPPVPPVPPALPASALPDDAAALYPNLRQMTEDDYHLIRDVLARQAQGAVPYELLRRLALTMAARVGARPPERDLYSYRLFLDGLADAYRKQNR